MEDQDDDTPDGPSPDSLLPYDRWTEEALKGVVARALAHVVAGGLPGDHHFYLTFRTDHPDTHIPARLRAQYPQEMTIVLQHQYGDLHVDEAGFSVSLSFGGVPSTLNVPFAALTAFADPHVQFGLRFSVAEPEAAAPEPEPTAPEPAPPPEASTEPQVVSLDAFRRRSPPKD